VHVELASSGYGPTWGARWWPTRHIPAWSGRSRTTRPNYFPAEDVRTELLAPTSTITHSPAGATRSTFKIKAGGKEVEDAGAAVCELPGRGAPQAHPPLDWDAMDGWFEEDEEVYTHPRDPYARRHPSLRRATCGRARRRGLADSTTPGSCSRRSSPRWYIPKVDSAWTCSCHRHADSTAPTRARLNTGRARWGDRLVRDLAWWYRSPLRKPEDRGLLPSTTSGSICSSTAAPGTARPKFSKQQI